MDTNRDLKDELGIVMSEIDYKESSKIIKVFTENHGLISVMVQGAKRKNSKTRNLSDLFVKASFNLTKGKNMYYLKDGSLIDMNLGLRKDIKKIYFSYFFSDLLVRSVMENDRQSRIFHLLDKSLTKLVKTDEYVKLSSSYIFKLVSFLGYKPNLSMCSNCGTRKFSRMYFSSENGGILCEKCKSMDIDRVEINKEEYKYIVDLIYSKIDDIDEIKEVNGVKIHRLAYNFYLIVTDNISFPSQVPIKKLNLL